MNEKLSETLQEAYALIERMADVLDRNNANSFNDEIVKILDALDNETAISEGLTTRTNLAGFNARKLHD
jgi:hypothetical protein